MIRPFDAHSAEGQEILWRLSEGVYQQEFYVMHFPPLDAMSRVDPSVIRSSRILASNRHLFCLSGTTPLLMTVVWKCSLLSVAGVKRTHQDGVVIDLKDSEVSLTAPNFYNFEITFLVLSIQRLVREAQGQRDITGNWDDISAPQLPIVKPKEKEEEDDDFVVVENN